MKPLLFFAATMASILFMPCLPASAEGCAGRGYCAVVTISTTGRGASQAMNPNFSGFNDWDQGATQYDDPDFNGLANKLTPGFLRYPVGMAGVAFDWQTGRDRLDWVNAFAGDPVERLEAIAYYIHLGKKFGSPFFLVDGKPGPWTFVARDQHAFTTPLNGGTKAPSIIFTFNTYTDRNGLGGGDGGAWVCKSNPAMADSASCLADLVIRNRLPVKVFELGNEPYYFTTCASNCKADFGVGHWRGAQDYLAWVKLYADSIADTYAHEHAPAPNLAVYAQAAGTPRNDDNGGTEPYLWDRHLEDYVAAHPAGVFWNTIAYHHYPAPSESCTPADTKLQCFQKWMNDENGELAYDTKGHVDYLDSLDLFGAGKPHQYEITEFNPTGGMGAKKLAGPGTDAAVDKIVFTGANSSLTNGTEYGAIYAAEYVMRMSALAEVRFVGMQSLQFRTGVDTANNEDSAVYGCGFAHTGCTDENHTVIDTRRWDRKGRACVSDPSTCFGYFVSAQGLGVELVNGIVNTAHNRYLTALQYPWADGAPPQLEVNIPRVGSKAGGGTAKIDSLYAQAYGDGVGAGAHRLSVLITNKGKFPVTVAIRRNGAPPYKGVMHEQFLTAPWDAGAVSDDGTRGALAPYAVNVAAKATNPLPGCAKTPSTCVSISHRARVANPVTVPAYSVTRVDLW